MNPQKAYETIKKSSVCEEYKKSMKEIVEGLTGVKEEKENSFKIGAEAGKVVDWSGDIMLVVYNPILTHFQFVNLGEHYQGLLHEEKFQAERTFEGKVLANSLKEYYCGEANAKPSSSR